MSRLAPASRARGRGVDVIAWVVAMLALLAILAGLFQLLAATRGLEITDVWSEGVPIRVYRPTPVNPAPVVVIAHGFAGSRELMEPYAVTLARNGYIAVTFDFAGHGRNANPFVSSLMDRDERLRVLLASLEPAIRVGLTQPGADGRLALLGHSMAGDVLAQHAQSHPGTVSALVLISPYLSEQTSTTELPNLLLIYGEHEPEALHRQGRDILAERGGDSAESPPRSELAVGDARRLVLADGVEHIGVLYSRAGLGAALDWLDATFERAGGGFIDARGPWLAFVYLGLLVLAWPLSRLLPRVSTTPRGAGLRWRRLLPVAIAPALLTPLILWKLPTDFLPILIGDYLALHFALYGSMTALGLMVLGVGPRRSSSILNPSGPVRFFIALLAVCAYGAVVIGLMTDRFVTNLFPGPERAEVVFAMLLGTAIYFTADEWLTRGESAPRWSYFLTKLLFILSLLLAVGLNLRELFFLIIIVPAMLILFVVYGLMSAWVYRRTGQPLIGAIANALVFAIAIAVTFPMVAA